MGDHQSPFEGPPPAAGGLAGTGGPDGLGGFVRSFLTDSVGRNGANRPDDVLTASRFLHANGLLAKPTREATEEFHRGIEAAQSKLNHLSQGGLQVDGIAKPWGPTELLSQRAVTSGQLTAPRTEEPGDTETEAGVRRLVAAGIGRDDAVRIAEAGAENVGAVLEMIEETSSAGQPNLLIRGLGSLGRLVRRRNPFEGAKVVGGRRH